MTGRYDDLSQEMWGRADADMPQEYLDAVLVQIMPPKRTVRTDADLDGSDKLHAIEGRLQGKQMPRFGQPNFDAPLVEWYHEYKYRSKNPLWWEREYYYTDDGKEIHEVRI